MKFITLIAERKIQKAIQNGLLEDNPLKGKPLHLEDLSHVPQELRQAYIILKNAHVLPQEVQLLKEIHNLQQLLMTLDEESPQYSQIKKKSRLKELEFNILMERKKFKINSSNIQYISKIKKTLGI